MNVRGEDGLPLRFHLIKSAYGIMPDEEALARLNSAPEMPTGTGNVWGAYKELDRRRSYNENGPVRFTWLDIQAYLSVTGLCFDHWELFTLLVLEDVFFSVEAANRK